ncbi:KIF6 [Symbiodinium natans]|uniref:KIF6 protein n=1 Tax=Symbiodinium natans TaxID=878477 RepID=A0A812TKP3_9DINO|nr:KIF6 [Symbiodinium natans]
MLCPTPPKPTEVRKRPPFQRKYHILVTAADGAAGDMMDKVNTSASADEFGIEDRASRQTSKETSGTESLQIAADSSDEQDHETCLSLSELEGPPEPGSRRNPVYSFVQIPMLYMEPSVCGQQLLIGRYSGSSVLRCHALQGERGYKAYIPDILVSEAETFPFSCKLTDLLEIAMRSGFVKAAMAEAAKMGVQFAVNKVFRIKAPENLAPPVLAIQEKRA